MKNIGIITFHSSHNCGSMLQAYALQTILESRYNAAPKFIDFVNEGSENRYRFYLKNNSVKNILKNILYFYYLKLKNTNYFRYEKFKEQYLHLTKERYSKQAELENIEEQFDMFISGGDQVWNITCDDADDSYFLPFVKRKRKIAYSPSLGAKSIKAYAEDFKKYADYLEQYDMLSVRESNGKKWLQELTDKNIKILCDPTLLLNSLDYDKIAEPVKTDKEYIFYYSYGYVANENEFVEQVAELLNMNVIIFNGKRWATIHRKYRSFRLPECEGPSSFLHIMKNASLVITSSFHGTVFSTIYHKKFWVIKNEGMINGDDRASCLLEQLGLTDRFVTSFDNLNKEKVLEDINYQAVDKNIEKLRKEAFDYLDKAMILDE